MSRGKLNSAKVIKSGLSRRRHSLSLKNVEEGSKDGCG